MYISFSFNMFIANSNQQFISKRRGTYIECIIKYHELFICIYTQMLKLSQNDWYIADTIKSFYKNSGLVNVPLSHVGRIDTRKKPNQKQTRKE